MSLQLTDEQIDVLLRAIHPKRVGQVQGNSHVEGYDIRAMLIRVFGFGSFDIHTDTVLVYEDREQSTKNSKPAVEVCYRSKLALTVHDRHLNSCTFEAVATATSKMPDYMRGDAHDFAIKTAETQALKRAAINLGDQFGLGLYRKGSTAALVVKVVGHNTAAEEAVEVDDARPEQTEMVDSGNRVRLRRRPACRRARACTGEEEGAGEEDSSVEHQGWACRSHPRPTHPSPRRRQGEDQDRLPRPVVQAVGVDGRRRPDGTSRDVAVRQRGRMKYQTCTTQGQILCSADESFLGQHVTVALEHAVAGGMATIRAKSQEFYDRYWTVLFNGSDTDTDEVKVTVWVAAKTMRPNQLGWWTTFDDPSVPMWVRQVQERLTKE